MAEYIVPFLENSRREAYHVTIMSGREHTHQFFVLTTLVVIGLTCIYALLLYVYGSHYYTEISIPGEIINRWSD